MIFAVLIIIMVVCLDIILENYSKKVISSVNCDVKEICKIFNENKNYNELEKISRKALKKWEEKENIMTCFVEHEEVGKINTNLKILHEQIKNKSWDDAKATSSETEQLIKYLDMKYSLTLQNIF